MVVRLSQRLYRLSRGLEKVEPKHQTAAQRGEIVELDYLDDPSLEPPYFTEKEFLRVEGQRLEFCNVGNRGIEKRYTEFFEALDKVVDLIGDQLVLVVIPDEYQVNDTLFTDVLATRDDPESYDRDYPQKRIAEWNRDRNIPLIDLLPTLREAEPTGRTYHLRDTHWNARGNRVAGEHIAEVLIQLSKETE